MKIKTRARFADSFFGWIQEGKIRHNKAPKTIPLDKLSTWWLSQKKHTVIAFIHIFRYFLRIVAPEGPWCVFSFTMVTRTPMLRTFFLFCYFLPIFSPETPWELLEFSFLIFHKCLQKWSSNNPDQVSRGLVLAGRFIFHNWNNYRRPRWCDYQGNRNNWYQLIRFSLIESHHFCQILNPLQQNKCATISCLQFSMCCKATSSCNPDQVSPGLVRAGRFIFQNWNSYRRPRWYDFEGNRNIWYQLIPCSPIGAHRSCQILNPLQQNKVSTISCLQLSTCQTAPSSCNPDKCSGEGPFFKTETITGAPGGAITKEIVKTGIK